MEPGHLLIDFTTIVPVATGNVSAGEWVKCQTTTKQEWVLWGETVFHYWQAVYVANSEFYLSVWSNYFHGKHHEISAALWSCRRCPVAPGWLSVHLFARRFGVSPSAVFRDWRIFRWTGQYSRRPGQGRRSNTTHQQDKYIILSARRFRRSTTRCLQSDLLGCTGVQISDQTVRNRLHCSELRSRRLFLGLILTPCHRVARRAFAREHQNWQVRHWRPLIFTDESRFDLRWPGGRIRVWRSTTKRYRACNIAQHDRYGEGSVMGWGGISLEGRTDLLVLNRGSLKGARYRDEILRPIVGPYSGVVGPVFLLVHGNAWPHVAKVCQRFLQDEGLDTINWPARSPDLNPIEHLWDITEQRIRRLPNPPRTVQELTLVEVWSDIDLGTIGLSEACHGVVECAFG